jgi:3-methyl-2-oxobutanoate hydroxymethyltransferase
VRKTINYFAKLKQLDEKFSCLTAYDASFAQAMEAAGVECLLIGDSLGMVIKGQESTLSVSLDEIIYHTQNVRRATHSTFIMSDLPFGLCGSVEKSYQAASALMSAGAQMVKIEGGSIMQETTQFLTDRGIPICSHLGLLPQSVHKIGGYKVQGKDKQTADQILKDAQLMEAAGADMLLLECVPKALAQQLATEVAVPVIGI